MQKLEIFSPSPDREPKIQQVRGAAIMLPAKSEMANPQIFLSIPIPPFGAKISLHKILSLQYFLSSKPWMATGTDLGRRQ